jgi:hypothetical protein
MQAFGGISSTVGAYYAANAQKGALRAQADIDRLNAATSDRAAFGVMRQGERAEQAKRLETAAVKGKARVAMASNGVALDSRTPQQVLNTTDVMGEIDALEINANAVRSAWGYKTQAVDHRNRAVLAEGQAAGISPFMAGLTSLIGSATSIAGNWYNMQKTGMFSSTSSKFSYADPQPGGLSSTDFYRSIGG